MTQRSIFPDVQVSELREGIDYGIREMLNVPVIDLGKLYQPEEVRVAWLPYLYAVFGILELYSTSLSESALRSIYAHGFRWHYERTTEVALSRYIEAIDASYYYRLGRDATTNRINSITIFVIPRGGRAIPTFEQEEYKRGISFLLPVLDSVTIQIVQAFEFMRRHYANFTRIRYVRIGQP